MWRSRSATVRFRSDVNRLSNRRGADRLAQPRFGDHVDGPAEESLESELEPREVEERSAGLERDEKIDVTVLALLSARCRTEQAHAMRAVFSRNAPDVVSQLG